MLKKILIAAVAASLVAVPVGGGALAKGKKKGPKPYVSSKITVQVGHPAAHSQSGTLLLATAQEFIRRCAIPASNGLDAAVWEVPAEYKGLEAPMKAVPSPTVAVPPDVDIYLFDESCTEVAYYNAVTEGSPEGGYLTKDTAFVLVHNYTGDPVTTHFELTPPGK